LSTTPLSAYTAVPENLSKPELDLARTQCQLLQTALAQLRVESLNTSAFSASLQNQQALRNALPVRFDEVLMQLMNRLESSALFTDESCSFSRHDLLDSLQLWLDKAEQNLQAQANKLGIQADGLS
jgi:hypothetical protein